MRLTRRRLNRTLLHRQHLLERTRAEPHEMVDHLVGLQAQENLPPYLSLAARLDEFDPYVVTRGLEERSLVRLTVMRGTIHLLTVDDALSLRQWTQPVQDRERKVSQNTRPAFHLDTDEVNAAVSDVLRDGPLPMKALGEALGDRFPGVPPNALAHLARTNQPLAQLPPRGAWKQSGGVVYQYVDRWLEQPLVDPDPEEIVRRYLRAFGPASATDVGAWSGLTRLAPLLKGMDDLVRHEDENGKALFDVPDGEFADEDAPGAGAAARRLRQRLALPRRPRPRHRRREARQLDGPQRWRRHDRLRRRLDGGPVADGGRPAHRRVDAPQAHQGRAVRPRRRARPRRRPLSSAPSTRR